MAGPQDMIIIGRDQERFAFYFFHEISHHKCEYTQLNLMAEDLFWFFIRSSEGASMCDV